MLALLTLLAMASDAVLRMELASERAAGTAHVRQEECRSSHALL